MIDLNTTTYTTIIYFVGLFTGIVLCILIATFCGIVLGGKKEKAERKTASYKDFYNRKELDDHSDL